jgi:hypothetical protein
LIKLKGLSIVNFLKAFPRKKRLEVVDIIAKTGKDLNLRKLVRGLNIRAAGMPDWQGLVKRYA